MKTIYEEEYYLCRDCDLRVGFEEINKKWNCPYCNNLLKVYAKSKNENRVISRKSWVDVRIDDIVDIPGSGYEFHMVLNKEKVGTAGKIALKNHGVVKLKEGDWLNCIEGTWDGNVSQL